EPPTARPYLTPTTTNNGHRPELLAAPATTCVSTPTAGLSTPTTGPIRALTCDDGHGALWRAALRVRTRRKRKGQRTHGFQGRRDRRLPAPRCSTHRSDRDSRHQRRGEAIPRSQGRSR